MPQELYERLDKIIQKKAEKKFIKTLNVIDPRIVDISLGSKNMIYFDLGLDRRIPLQIMGDGIGRLLSILVTIANFENGIVLIDEIENGFHSSTLDLLWSSIRDVAEAYNVQIFATTHSIECVKTFSNTFTNDLLGADNIRLYRLERSKDNQFKAFKYTGEVLQSALESNWEIR
jgi:AAA15 family ATPase/GTPase